MSLPSTGDLPENPPPPPALSIEAEREVLRPVRSLVVPVALFLLTLITTTIAGADMMYLFRRDLAFTVDFERYLLLFQNPLLLVDGLLFSIPLLLILFAHEMGHFLACEYYQVDATYPYFIPFPTPIGTMGAFIRIRAPIANSTLSSPAGLVCARHTFRIAPNVPATSVSKNPSWKSYYAMRDSAVRATADVPRAFCVVTKRRCGAGAIRVASPISRRRTFGSFSSGGRSNSFDFRGRDERLFVSPHCGAADRIAADSDVARRGCAAR